LISGANFRGRGGCRVRQIGSVVAPIGFTLLTNIATGLNLSDMEAGYKVFRADVLRRIHL
jgi:hypothetical protein